MKIDSAVVGMESARTYRATWKTTSRFEIRDYQNQENERGTDVESREENGRTQSLEDHQGRLSVGAGKAVDREKNQTETQIRQMTVRYIFQMLFAARRGKLRQWQEENGLQGNGSFLAKTQSPTLYLSQTSEYSEQEEMSFSTKGQVKTSDGRTIDFGINIEMSQSFFACYREELEMNAASLCDPIVLNLDTSVTSLSDQTFYFDLDADGTEDKLNLLNAGSGFLALDKNANGKIDDGSELFGTQSGDGFGDLAAYDRDGNGWIDENDEVFDKLKIWYKDASGKDMLMTLKEAGVGAISLQNLDTTYQLKNDPDSMKGMIRRTGIFLYENGGVGTMMHVDLAKH